MRRRKTTTSTTTGAVATSRPTQLSLDLVDGQRRRDFGADLALDAALPWALRAERWLLSRDDPFTADHLVAAIGLPHQTAESNRNNAVGALFLRWSRREAIHAVGVATARRSTSHARRVVVWMPAHTYMHMKASA